MKKALFIDRDGTLVLEPPVDYQLDSFSKLQFYPGLFTQLAFLKSNTDFEWIMVTNQDGLGTESFPEETFWPVQNFILSTLEGEGIVFDNICIDKSFPYENLPTRKPGTGMLSAYLTGDYDMDSSFVIGDRLTDVQLAHNIGCKAIWIYDKEDALSILKESRLESTCALISSDWSQIVDFIYGGERSAIVERSTNETDICIALSIDGKGDADIHTGIGFFDHMLEQIAKHGGISLNIGVKGDLNVDEHHTIEDTAIALGEALYKALGSKRGVERYGYALPMDDCAATVLLDFGGRPWLVWDVELKREKVGDLPTEMLMHFFKSLSDNAKMNLHISATGENEHHKIEGIFKAFARAIKMAVKRDIFQFQLPSTKGIL